jgi:hypothetical protein
MKLVKRCRCKQSGSCGFDPTTCLFCGGRIIKNLKLAREFDRDNEIDRNNEKTTP